MKKFVLAGLVAFAGCNAEPTLSDQNPFRGKGIDKAEGRWDGADLCRRGIKKAPTRGEIITKAYNNDVGVWALGYEAGMKQAGCEPKFPWKKD